MTIAILFAISIIASIILAWLFRRRFAEYIPSKSAVSTFGIAAPVVLLLCLAILPDVLLLISAIAFMPHYLKIVVGLSAATCIIYAGCSKRTEVPKQPAIHWSAPETGYQADTPPDPQPETQ